MRSATLLCGLAAFGAERWTTPVLGHIFDENSKAIHQVTGIAGAAGLGSAVPIPVKADRASVAWGGRPWAVVAAAEGGSFGAAWSESGPRLAAMQGAIAWTDAAWSGTDAVALYSRDSGLVQVWRGLPGSPEIVREVQVTSLAAVAVATDGTFAAASEAEVRIWESGTVRQVSFAGARALAWLGSSQGGLVAIGATGAVVIRNGKAEPAGDIAPGALVLGVSPDGTAAVSCIEGVAVVSRIGSSEAVSLDGPGCGDGLQWLRSDVFSIRTSNGEQWLAGTGGTSILLTAGGGR